MDVKFSKAQLSKIIKSGEFLGKMLCNVTDNLDKKTLSLCCF